MSHLLRKVFMIILAAIILVGCIGQDFAKSTNKNTVAGYGTFLQKKHHEWISLIKKEGIDNAARSLCRETAEYSGTHSSEQLLAPYYVYISKPRKKWACENTSHADCYKWTKEDLNKKIRSSWAGPIEENTVVICIEENKSEQIDICRYSGGRSIGDFILPRPAV